MGIVIGIGVVVAAIVALFAAGYVKSPPDTAYIISGFRKPRILIGKAGFRIPFLERLDKLSLKMFSVDVTVIQGRITKEFLSYLTESSKPNDTEIYNKMTPFFTIIFGNKLHSEHYGTEIIISKAIREKTRSVEHILDQMEDFAVVHRNIPHH